MKLLPLVLAGSLVANLALVGFLLLRSPSNGAPSSALTPHTGNPLATTAADQARASALQAAFAGGDASALAAAGCPPDAIRWLTTGRAFDTFQARMRALRPARTDNRYWQRNDLEAMAPRTNRVDANKAERDFSEAVRLAYGEDLEALFSDRDSSNSFLSPAKREQLRRIEKDYADMEQQIEADQSGVQLPSDQEKLKLLRAEKDRDIAAALTPEEREQYELHTSNTAANVRGRYGDALQTEEDYRKVFALQKAFDDRYNNQDRNAGGPPSPDLVRARREAEQKLQEDIRAAIDPAQWAAAQRANDPDLRTLTSLSRRLSLPATAADTILAARETYAAQSMEINANAALSAAERRSQLQALANKAQTDLQATLGAEGGQAFAQRTQWVNMLKNGQAFSTNPKDSPNTNAGLGMSVFPVPARVPPPPDRPKQ